MHRTRRLLTSLLLAVVLTASFGCITTTQVREIVTQSNAAMIDAPGLARSPDPTSPDWREAVARIDRLIERNPNEKTLVATLRLRQAVLLTSRQQIAAAKDTWAKVDRTGLTTARDLALHALRNDLVWWYEHAGAASFGPDEIKAAGEAKKRFAEVCEDLPRRSEIRLYLETMRASLALKAANATSTFENPQAQEQVSAAMVEDLKRLVDLYGEEDHQWVQKNATGSQSEAESWIATLRARVWLRDLIREYGAVAEEKGLTPAWDPEWIGQL